MKRRLMCLSLLAIVFILTGCSRIENNLYGTWKYSLILSDEDFGDHIDKNKYNSEGNVTFRIIGPKKEISFNFFAKEAGEWQLHNNKELVETTIDGIFTPLDDLSKKMLKVSPEFSAMVRPIKGSTETIKILSLSKTVMEIEEEDGSKILLRKDE